MTVFYIISLVAALLLFDNMTEELKRDLMMLQQNSYRPERYNRWLSESKDSTSGWRLAALIIFFCGLTSFANNIVVIAACGIFAILNIVSLSRRKYKKPLVWTARAVRIFAAASCLTLVISAGITIFAVKCYGSNPARTLCEAVLGCYCSSHIIILAANYILKPVESAITRRYYNQARNILRSMPDLKIIGITGSFGKTSTKHYLHRILSEQYDTLMTPGSFNTTLGVVRTVREHLKPYNEVFIVEMGAKNIGDIKEICDLVHPHAGIITAVGPQHLESFKTLENVQRTKFELADALPSDGIAIVNDDFPKIADRPVENCRCECYGITNTNATWRATDIVYSSGGTDFKVIGPDGFNLNLHTRLMGEANVSDLLAAVVCAQTMGVNDKNIAAAIASIEPVEHRLSVKRTPGGITILDDAYNSNPVGSRMAMEVLGAMKGGRRIVITPGMIELGENQYDLNKALGTAIAGNADIAIIVGRYNRDAIIEGIREAGFPEENLIVADTFNEAQQNLGTIARSGDTVLYENDLPDTFK